MAPSLYMQVNSKTYNFEGKHALSWWTINGPDNHSCSKQWIITANRQMHITTSVAGSLGSESVKVWHRSLWGHISIIQASKFREGRRGTLEAAERSVRMMLLRAAALIYHPWYTLGIVRYSAYQGPAIGVMHRRARHHCHCTWGREAQQHHIFHDHYV